MLNLINRRIDYIIKHYILNKASVDIEKNRMLFKDKPDLLDNIAIFLRILDENIIEELEPTDTYINHDKSFNELKSKIINDINEIISIEQEISNMLEKVIDKPIESDLGYFKFYVDVKTLFITNGKNNSIETLENELVKLQDFHKKLLSYYGKFYSKKNEYDLKIKQGLMSRYFELGDLILVKVEAIKKEIENYKIYVEEEKKYTDKISTINNIVLLKIADICNQKDDLFTTFINDIKEFIKIKCKENQ